MSTTPITPPSEATPAVDINTPTAELRSAAIAASQPVAPTPTSEPTPAPTATPAQTEGPAATAPPASTPYSVTQNPDGSVEIKLETGEVFKGSPVEVATRLAEAKVNTTKHYKEQLAATQPAQSAQAAQPATPAVSPENQEAMNWLLGLAKSNPQFAREMMSIATGLPTDVVGNMGESGRVQATNNAIGQFLTECPDFPNTKEAADLAMEYLPADVLEERRPPTVKEMKAAHAMAMYEKKYAPLTAEQQAASRGQTTTNARPTPAPMLPTSAPSMPAGEVNAYDLRIPLDKIREQALGRK